jgi:transposase-like protein
VKAITEELCGHSFSASSISAINQRLDDGLAQFAGRPLAEAFPYLILDARYERVCEAGVIVSQAVLIAIGIDWDGRRQVLAVELANRESRSSWRDFLLGLKAPRRPRPRVAVRIPKRLIDIGVFARDARPEVIELIQQQRIQVGNRRWRAV